MVLIFKWVNFEDLFAVLTHWVNTCFSSAYSTYMTHMNTSPVSPCITSILDDSVPHYLCPKPTCSAGASSLPFIDWDTMLGVMDRLTLAVKKLSLWVGVNLKQVFYFHNHKHSCCLFFFTFKNAGLAELSNVNDLSVHFCPHFNGTEKNTYSWHNNFLNMWYKKIKVSASINPNIGISDFIVAL